jgi:hypothetical protein
MPRMQTTTATATDSVSDRPPIFSALYVLGLNNAQIGRLLRVTSMTISEWSTGRKRIPLVRHLALLFMVTRLTGVVGGKHLPNTRYARRAEIAVDAANRWAQLARAEIAEEVGSTYTAEELERSYELGRRMLAKLEMQ